MTTCDTAPNWLARRGLGGAAPSLKWQCPSQTTPRASPSPYPRVLGGLDEPFDDVESLELCLAAVLSDLCLAASSFSNFQCQSKPTRFASFPPKTTRKVIGQGNSRMGILLGRDSGFALSSRLPLVYLASPTSHIDCIVAVYSISSILTSPFTDFSLVSLFKLTSTFQLPSSFNAIFHEAPGIFRLIKVGSLGVLRETPHLSTKSGRQYQPGTRVYAKKGRVSFESRITAIC